jgi:hypothetical protein
MIQAIPQDWMLLNYKINLYEDSESVVDPSEHVKQALKRGADSSIKQRSAASSTK